MITRSRWRLWHLHPPGKGIDSDNHLPLRLSSLQPLLYQPPQGVGHRLRIELLHTPIAHMGGDVLHHSQAVPLPDVTPYHIYPGRPPTARTRDLERDIRCLHLLNEAIRLHFRRPLNARHQKTVPPSPPSSWPGQGSSWHPVSSR